MVRKPPHCSTNYNASLGWFTCTDRQVWKMSSCDLPAAIYGTDGQKSQHFITLESIQAGNKAIAGEKQTNWRRILVRLRKA